MRQIITFTDYCDDPSNVDDCVNKWINDNFEVITIIDIIPREIWTGFCIHQSRTIVYEINKGDKK